MTSGQWIYRGVFPEKAVVRFGRTIRIKRAELVREGWLSDANLST